MYSLFAAAWIFLSDRFLLLLVPDAAVLMRWSVVKGLAFVLATSLLLYLLIRRGFGALEKSHASLRAKEAERRVHEMERQRADEARRSERELSNTIVDSLPGILYLYDADGQFLRWNRNFAEMSGYSDDEIARMHPLDFFDEPDRSRVKQRIGEVFERGAASVEAAFVARDGTATPHFFTGMQLDYNGVPCLVGMGVDISERTRAETALRELNESLEAKVAGRTEELRAALIQAESADRVKSAFLATMSHELRTPLNSIIGFTGIILQEMAGPVTAEQKKQLGMVRDSSRHLLALINDVLDISRIEAGQLTIHREPFSLRDSIEHSVETLRPMAERRGLSLTVRIDPALGEVLSDRRRTDQILLNLLNNALKFTETGGVTLTADIETVSNEAAALVEQVRIRVIDTGIGIGPEDLDTLFRPFRQIDSGLSRHHEGTGLGLVICRRLATLLGGGITVESMRGHGSTFTFVLPARPELATEDAVLPFEPRSPG